MALIDGDFLCFATLTFTLTQNMVFGLFLIFVPGARQTIILKFHVRLSRESNHCRNCQILDCSLQQSLLSWYVLLCFIFYAYKIFLVKDKT